MPIGNYGEVMNPPRNNFGPNAVPTYPSNGVPMSMTQPNARLQDQFRQIVPVNGYMVRDLSDIKPRDVPMDGSVSWFPQEDFTCIWARMWNKDGQLMTFKFVEEVPNVPAQNQVNQPDEFQATLMSRLDALQASIETIMSSMEKPTAPKTKKEEDKK